MSPFVARCDSARALTPMPRACAVASMQQQTPSGALRETPNGKENTMHTTRRQIVKTSGILGTLLSLGLITEAQAQSGEARPGFAAKDLQGALNHFGGTPATSDQLRIEAPDIAENGAVVPVGASSSLPGTTEIWFLVEKNPNPLAGGFTFPEGTLAEVQTRIKMSQTSNVVVVARAGGKLYSATKETKVTLGGCGG